MIDYNSPANSTSSRLRGLSLFLISTSLCLGFFSSLAWSTPSSSPPIQAPQLPDRALQSSDAQWFIAQVNHALKSLYVAQSKAAWLNATDITEEHGRQLASRTSETMAYLSAVIPLAARFDEINTDPITRRQLTLLKRSTTLPAPSDDEKRTRLATIAAQLESMYGQGKACREIEGKQQCADLEALEEIMRTSKDPQALERAWLDWRSVSVSMRPLYAELVDLANEGARTLNFQDLGDLWRSQYDMSPADFEAEIQRLWSQVKPLYDALHCHVRAKLNERYGDQVVSLDKPIPAHLLGNMWAQDWGQLYPLLVPKPEQPSLDVTAQLVAQGYQPHSLTRLAEQFFTSLGLDPLPQSFWERSLFEKPTDREVVCHASAWDVEINDDLRLKMCIKIDDEDLITLHHELGHHYYYHAYYTLPLLLQEGANDGFHEGIGDTLALSVTPSYLHQRGILKHASEHPDAILNQQMKMGLERLAFLPFGLLVDQWRWRVFSGEVKPEGYNQLWWSLRESLQGIQAPVQRGRDAFDPGAKYHIPGHTPYMRYFIAHILQFQFHRALCREAGHSGPLHTCSIYGSKAAGEKLWAMLSLGASQPWPIALEALTGSTEMDASAIKEYFQPLYQYLQDQNQGRKCGW